MKSAFGVSKLTMKHDDWRPKYAIFSGGATRGAEAKKSYSTPSRDVSNGPIVGRLVLLNLEINAGFLLRSNSSYSSYLMANQRLHMLRRTKLLYLKFLDFQKIQATNLLNQLVQLKEQLTRDNSHFFLQLNNDKITYCLNNNNKIRCLKYGRSAKKSESGDQQRPEFAQDGLPKIVLDALPFLAAVSNSVPCGHSVQEKLPRLFRQTPWQMYLSGCKHSSISADCTSYHETEKIDNYPGTWQ